AGCARTTFTLHRRCSAGGAELTRIEARLARIEARLARSRARLARDRSPVLPGRFCAMPIEGPGPHDIGADLSRSLSALRMLAERCADDARVVGALGHVAAAVALLESVPGLHPLTRPRHDRRAVRPLCARHGARMDVDETERGAPADRMGPDS